MSAVVDAGARLIEALEAHQRGWQVHRLHYINPVTGRCSCSNRNCPEKQWGKHPVSVGWSTAPRPTEQNIRAWFGPQAEPWNVGILTGKASGIVLLDIDPRSGGFQSLEKLEREHGRLPVTPAVITPRGVHLVFGNDRPLKSVDEFAEGIELKADGKQVVAPTSQSKYGVYRWDDGRHPDDTPLAPLPDWIRELAVQRTSAKGSAAPIGDKIPEKQRNNTLTSLAGTMRRRDMSESAMLAALLVVNEERCEPPLPTREVEKIARSVARYEPEDPVTGLSSNGHSDEDIPDTAAEPRRFPLTDTGNAERLAHRHGAVIRYNRPRGIWHVWDGQRWAVDETGRLEQLTKETVRAIPGEAKGLADDQYSKTLKWAAASESGGRREAMIRWAQSEPGIPVRPDQLDANPWLLNVRNGTVDLRTGELRPHRREDLITKMAPVDYDPNARLELWDTFLAAAAGNDAEVAAFLQRAAGYSACGDTSEEKLFFVHGPGAAGKSTFGEAVKATLGDYAATADFETFLRRRDSGGARPDIARLAGARYVPSIEVDDGKQLAQGLLKQLTGGDTVTARFLYQGEFEYKPQFVLWLIANHAPTVPDDDDAFWRRIVRVPFEHVIPEDQRDPHVKKMLTDPAIAGPAILAWLVAGCREWQRSGLRIPDKIKKATAAYRQDMDPLRDFIDSCCALNAELWTSTKAIRTAYEAWARDEGVKEPLTSKAIAARLKAHGCEPKSSREGGSVVRGWAGIGLVVDGSEPTGQRTFARSDADSHPAPRDQVDPSTTRQRSEARTSTEKMPDSAAPAALSVDGCFVESEKSSRQPLYAGFTESPVTTVNSQQADPNLCPRCDAVLSDDEFFSDAGLCVRCQEMER